METQIGAIGNYYGSLYIYEKNDKYFWGIEDYNGTTFREITKELYDALIKYERERKK